MLKAENENILFILSNLYVMKCPQFGVKEYNQEFRCP